MLTFHFARDVSIFITWIQVIVCDRIYLSLMSFFTLKMSTTLTKLTTHTHTPTTPTHTHTPHIHQFYCFSSIASFLTHFSFCFLSCENAQFSHKKRFLSYLCCALNKESWNNLNVYFKNYIDTEERPCYIRAGPFHTWLLSEVLSLFCFWLRHTLWIFWSCGSGFFLCSLVSRLTNIP